MMKTLLVPIDFSRVSKQVVAQAAALARALRGRIVLLNVTAPPFAATGERDSGVEESVAQSIAGVARSAGKRLERLQKKLTADGIKASTVQLTGLPVTLILRQARAVAADYIVMGSHGHNAFYDLVVGSTASGVMKSTDCPVLIVPRPLQPPRKGRP